MRDILAEDGLIYTEHDPEALAAILNNLVSHPEKLEEISKKFREYVMREHDLKKLIPKIISRLA